MARYAWRMRKTAHTNKTKGIIISSYVLAEKPNQTKAKEEMSRDDK